MTLFLGLEWFSICLYILCAIDIDLVGSFEAGLKYLVIGSFGSAMLLFGSALVYGATGELELNQIADAVQSQGLSHDALLVAGLAFVIVGLGFKASAAPFHMWTPDVYEGSPTPVTAFMSAATKTVALVLMMRVLVTAFPQEARLWTITIAVIACASLAVGNLAALVQREREAHARLLVDLAGRLHADRDLDEQRARRASAALLPDPVRGDVGRLVRGRRRPGARAEPAGHVRRARGLRLGAAAAGRKHDHLHARLRRVPADRRVRRQVLRLLGCVRARLDLARDRRPRRDGRQPLLLPRGHPRDVHAPFGGAPARTGGRRLTAPGAAAADGRRRGDGDHDRRRSSSCSR